MMLHGSAPLGAADEPSTGSGSRRNRRLGLIAALTCGLGFCLVMVMVIVGGLVLLVSQRREASQIATVPLEVDGISTVIPEGWNQLDTEGDAGLDILAVHESPDGAERLTISRVEVELDAEGICELLQDSAKEQGLATESAEILEPVTVDGTSALRYQWIAYDQGSWQQSDAYCMDHSSGTVFVMAENETDEEAVPSPAAALMLEQWRWTA